jgi:hypothetical protein
LLGHLQVQNENEGKSIYSFWAKWGPFSSEKKRSIWGSKNAGRKKNIAFKRLFLLIWNNIFGFSREAFSSGRGREFVVINLSDCRFFLFACEVGVFPWICPVSGRLGPENVWRLF